MKTALIIMMFLIALLVVHYCVACTPLPILRTSFKWHKDQDGGWRASVVCTNGVMTETRPVWEVGDGTAAVNWGRGANWAGGDDNNTHYKNMQTAKRAAEDHVFCW